MTDRAAGATLCRAFLHDPAISWAVQSADSRRAMQGWYSGIISLGRKRGAVDTLGDEPRAVAVTLPGPATFWAHVGAGLVVPTLRLGPKALRRFLAMSFANETKHAQLCPEAHVYLYFLGVDPSHQGQGLGSTLLRALAERADGERKPMYLETATQKNVPLYQRHGFEAVYEGETNRGGPHFWLMKRKAR